ncbi:hypothetical protein LRS10_13605 [Phenylobacterium sp. J426]|uniref:hypothetical protein n=1 Tax=Phenylobacterium sp. J426 TaxID=2898439 RepID=UPI002151DC06|nr:hypothetical protein [Phenylobacterium sp. J426]MCR5875129.1 hypothetical protein [Phenylobacterium sp. J426]
MNYSTAIFLVNSDVRAVSVSYETDSVGNGVGPFTLYKTLDPDIAKGDYVVIPTDTRHKMTVGRVEAVDVEVDFDSAVQVKWLIGRVDTIPHAEVVAKEAAAIQAMKSAEARSRREELAKKLLADNPELEGLSFTAKDAALPAPPEA